MKQKSIKELEEIYEIDFDRTIAEIKEAGAKNVLLQFPDGLKYYATSIVDFLEEHFPNTNFLIWLGKCYGACDTPVGIENSRLKIDLVIQFGHNEMMPSY